MRDWERWRAARLAALNADDGPPTLVATYWLDETDRVPGIDGTWLMDDGVVLRLADGRELSALRTGEPFGPRLRVGHLIVEVTNRHDRLGVRVFDPSCARSATVGVFPPDVRWVVPGMFSPDPNGVETYAFEHEAEPRELPVPGTVSFTLDGTGYTTRPFQDDGGLLLVFADATTGKATKPPSRFLFICEPDGADVVLDFNRSYLPPCAFSDQFSCPLPPVAHRLAAAVTAGETWPEAV